MRAVICQEAALRVEDVPEPRPERGQVLLSVTRCGICGSDLHARTGCDDFAPVMGTVGYERFMRSHEPVVFGHEFTGEVLEHGSGCREDVPAGSPVVALPIVRWSDGEVDGIGLSTHAPGAYAERVVVQEALTMPVPNGLPAEIAALTEPMAVAYHAVRRGEVRKKDVAIVIGAGPIGLGVILMLKALGVRTVIASDFSPGRRQLASRCGADVVVDPATQSPYDAADGKGHLKTVGETFELAIDGMEKLRRIPLVDWSQVYRVAQKAGAIDPKRPVVFECVGVPGVIDDIVLSAPLYSRVVVAGVCLGQDVFQPAIAITKELDLRFCFGYTPLEFRDTLKLLADGRVDPRPLITGTVGLDGVAEAFSALARPERHAKILIDPRTDGRSRD